MPDFKGFAQNHMTKYFIGEDKSNLLALAGGIITVDTDFDEDSDDVGYYDNNGGTETISQGKSFPFSFEGHRKYGDPAQELIRQKLTANDSKVYFIIVEPDGSQMEGDANLSDIKPMGGDANERSTFEGTVAFAGAPLDFNPAGTERNGRAGTKTTVPTGASSAQAPVKTEK